MKRFEPPSFTLMVLATIGGFVLMAAILARGASPALRSTAAMSGGGLVIGCVLSAAIKQRNKDKAVRRVLEATVVIPRITAMEGNATTAKPLWAGSGPDQRFEQPSSLYRVVQTFDDPQPRTMSHIFLIHGPGLGRGVTLLGQSPKCGQQLCAAMERAYRAGSGAQEVQ